MNFIHVPAWHTTTVYWCLRGVNCECSLHWCFQSEIIYCIIENQASRRHVIGKPADWRVFQQYRIRMQWRKKGTYSVVVAGLVILACLAFSNYQQDANIWTLLASPHQRHTIKVNRSHGGGTVRCAIIVLYVITQKLHWKNLMIILHIITREA